MKKLNNLLDKDFHIVEKRKLIFGIPIAILVVAVIMMIIFHFTLGSALNLGTDFTGGYSVDVKIGDRLTDDNRESYYERIEEALKSVPAENGKTYNITISGAMQSQGSGSSSSIHVKYAAVKGVSENEMAEYVNPAIIDKLEHALFIKIPEVAIEGNVVKVTYDEPIDNVGANNTFDRLCDKFLSGLAALNSDHGANLSAMKSDIAIAADNKKQVVITSTTSIASSDALKEAIVSQLSISDNYSGSVIGGSLTSATVSSELLFNAILAVSLALIFMLCYIGLRFQLSSGLACIIALFHDIIMVFAAMAIFHIEINSTFIAAIITVLGYSINNSIILFDRVREKMRSVYSKSQSPEMIANASIKDTLLRSINTTVTTLIMILMVAIIGVPDIRVFAFPIIIGLIAGTFSSICIAPSFWALFQRIGKNKENFTFAPKNKKDKNDKNSVTTSEVGA